VRSIKYREATLVRADGVVAGVANHVAVPRTTPSAALRNGTFLLLPQPPLLGEEGKLFTQRALCLSFPAIEMPQWPSSRRRWSRILRLPGREASDRKGNPPK
jgi:hypothetical protein